MRLIDADEIDFNEVFIGASEFAKDTREAAQMLIDNQPAVEAVPVVHGEWIDGCCSNCGSYVPTDSCIDFIDEKDCNFCYSCGADMRKKV